LTIARDLDVGIELFCAFDKFCRSARVKTPRIDDLYFAADDFVGAIVHFAAIAGQFPRI
jgi:hypothetical protein